MTEPPPFPDGTVDLVVCRNVTIYFSRETTRALVGRFRTCVTPAGWLLLGPAETLWQLSDAFTLAGVGEAFAYRPAAPMTAALPVAAAATEAVRRGRVRPLLPRRDAVRPVRVARPRPAAQLRRPVPSCSRPRARPSTTPATPTRPRSLPGRRRPTRC